MLVVIILFSLIKCLKKCLLHQKMFQYNLPVLLAKYKYIKLQQEGMVSYLETICIACLINETFQRILLKLKR